MQFIYQFVTKLGVIYSKNVFWKQIYDMRITNKIDIYTYTVVKNGTEG